MRTSRIKTKSFASLLSAAFLLSACSNMEGYREQYPEPNDRLDHILALYETQREDGKECHEMWYPGTETRDCGRLLSELDRLLAEFPNHQRIMMSNAVYSYKAGRRDKASQVLDQLLSRPGAHPEAAVLRAKIALEEGNETLAEQVLRRQIMLSPGHPDLRSAMASVYYVKGDYRQARTILNLQRQHNDRPWELNYHLGLLAEGEGDWAGACGFYQQALIQDADFMPAAARMVGLAEHVSCSSGSGEYSTQSAVTYPVDTTQVAVTEATAFVLNDIQVSDLSGDRVSITFNTQGYNPNVRALQVASSSQVIIDLPGATSNVGWQSNDFQNDFVQSIKLENAGDRVRVRIALLAKVDAQLVNEAGGLQLVLVRGR